MISKEILQCTEDMRLALQEGKISLDSQTRAYDLLEKLLDLLDGGVSAAWCSCLGPAEEFCAEYYRTVKILNRKRLAVKNHVRRRKVFLWNSGRAGVEIKIAVAKGHTGGNMGMSVEENFTTAKRGKGG